jgi:hypothetical protein
MIFKRDGLSDAADDTGNHSATRDRHVRPIQPFARRLFEPTPGQGRMSTRFDMLRQSLFGTRIEFVQSALLDGPQSMFEAGFVAPV